MSSQIILYDLPSRQGTAWSLNPWKSNITFVVQDSGIQTNINDSSHGPQLQEARLQNRMDRIPRSRTNIQVLVHPMPCHPLPLLILTPITAVSRPTTPNQLATTPTTLHPPSASLTAPTCKIPGPLPTSSRSATHPLPCTSPTPSCLVCAIKSLRS